jgi:hypothetical protein
MSRDVLADLAALGPFFAVDAHPPGESPQPPWLPLGELIRRPELLRRRIAAVGSGLAASAGTRAEQIEPRVAASTAHFGLVARLVSPVLGVLALGYQLSPEPADLWWRDVPGGPLPLSVPAPLHRLDGHPRTVEASCRQLVSEMLEPVTAAAAEVVPMSFRVLWGNVASAVNSASLQIGARQPAVAETAWHLAETVFAAPQLRSERSAPGPGFRRSSCCLFYRVAPGGRRDTCGDCVLRHCRPASTE